MSKIIEANKKIEKTVVEGAVTGSYQKVEDKFVDAFLRKDGETVESAKERIKAEQKEREGKRK